MSIKLTDEIDNANNQFTSTVKTELKDLEKFSESGLDWLMLEHYQFSVKNTHFLSAAVNTTKQFQEQGISEELQRNFNEEKNHASIYKNALSEIGTNVESRVEFSPTTEFFASISKLITSCPSCTLGAMYATETAAIFEHEVFRDISNEVIRRREREWGKSRLKYFHDMHLNGVEQGHKDGLGMFVDLAEDHAYSTPNARDIGQLIQKKQVVIGANQAITAMRVWWKALLTQAKNMDK